MPESNIPFRSEDKPTVGKSSRYQPAEVPYTSPSYTFWCGNLPLGHMNKIALALLAFFLWIYVSHYILSSSTFFVCNHLLFYLTFLLRFSLYLYFPLIKMGLHHHVYVIFGPCFKFQCKFFMFIGVCFDSNFEKIQQWLLQQLMS